MGLSQTRSVFVPNLGQTLLTRNDFCKGRGVVTDSFWICAKSVPNIFCWVRLQHLAWSCQRLVMPLCQIRAKHFQLGTISARVVGLSQTCSVFVLNLCSTLFAWHKFCTWRGVVTDSFCLCAKSAPNIFCLVKILHLAWACHRHDLVLFQGWANYVLLVIISALGVDLGLTHYYFVPSLRQTVTDRYILTLDPDAVQLWDKPAFIKISWSAWVWICVIWHIWDKQEDEFGTNLMHFRFVTDLSPICHFFSRAYKS